MAIQEVTIYHLPSGWNKVTLSSKMDVDSSLGAFTWRSFTNARTLPMDAVVVGRVDFSRDGNPKITIATDLDTHLNPDHPSLVLDIAGRLYDKIITERDRPVAEPYKDYELELLNSSNVDL